jgi:erythritol transport system ATP-binding protein
VSGDRSEMNSDAILEARGVTKYYGVNTALKDVSYRVYRGQVNVLIGENGAGKSTLMRLLAGADRPSSGEIWMEGGKLDLQSPHDAAQAGIAIVHQELAIFGNLDVTDNIFAGCEAVLSGVFVDRSIEESRTRQALGELQKPLDVATLADTLSLGNRQIVEVARSLVHRAKILILDEPTSALSASESATLLRLVAELKNNGVTIIYISHRLHELLHIGDRFTVLRDGEIAGEGVRGEIDREWIVRTMSGDLRERPTPAARTAAPVFELEVQCLTARPTLLDVNFNVRRGEIVGIYGLLGAGPTELMETLAGLRDRDSGEVKSCGKQVPAGSVQAALECGLALAPEDRQKDGLVMDLSIRENINLASLAAHTHAGLLSCQSETQAVRTVAKRLLLKATDLELPVSTLSGGNQQKVVLARCLMQHPTVILLDEPTRGVDVSAKAEIYSVLRELAAEGISVLFTSSEIEEMQTLAERVLVMTQGRIVAEFHPSEATEQAIFSAACPRLEGVAA